MAELDMITGLKGAGKTTVINRLLRGAYRNDRVSVIQNELGRTALDVPALELGAAARREVTGGCVCCTMQVNLLEGIRDQLERFAPERIVLEPAGAARPEELLAVLAYRPELRLHLLLHVLDGPRFLSLLETMGTAFTDPIRQSRYLYVNRLSLCPDRAGEILTRLRELRGDAVIFHDAPELLPERENFAAFSPEELLRRAAADTLAEEVRRTVTRRPVVRYPR